MTMIFIWYLLQYCWWQITYFLKINCISLGSLLQDFVPRGCKMRHLQQNMNFYFFKKQSTTYFWYSQELYIMHWVIFHNLVFDNKVHYPCLHHHHHHYRYQSTGENSVCYSFVSVQHQHYDHLLTTQPIMNP